MHADVRVLFACMRCDGIVNNIVTMLTLQSRDVGIS